MNGTGGFNTGRTGTGMETGTERAVQRGRHAGENGERATQARAGGQGKIRTVGGACATVPGVLRVGRCRLDSAPTTLATDETGVWRPALRGMSHANMDLGILQETKLTDGIYTRGSVSYSVIAMDAPSRHCGGVALFYRSEPHFVVEAVEYIPG